MDPPRWRPVRELGLPEPIHPDLVTEPIEDEEPALAYDATYGGTLRPGLQGRDCDFPSKKRKPWAAREGPLMRLLEHYHLRSRYCVFLRSFREDLARMKRDPRCDGRTRDLIREYLTGGES